jgi:hypothetical protein
MDLLLKYADDINLIDNNNYFTTLAKNPNIDKFLISQECFISAVDHWSRLLGLLLFYVPTDKERLIIIKNLNDEHGEGDLNSSHTNTFKLLLKSLNYDKDILLYNEELQSYNYVNKFNNNLKDIITTQSWIYSVAMLAMIEYTYVIVSKNIHIYLLNYLPINEINHYSLHETLDVTHVTHATELFDLLIPYMKNNELSSEMKSGIITGYTIMNELYLSLHEFL